MWGAVDRSTSACCFAFKVRSGEGFRVEEAILIPLALSYVTFQQIGFVVACYRGRIGRVSPRDYLFFVLFFPAAGDGADRPLRGHGGAAARTAPAARRPRAATPRSAFRSSSSASPRRCCSPTGWRRPSTRSSTTARHAPIGLAESWFAIIAFQLQLYFDFAGYADMAIGLGRMFGIRLPINFDRPLFAKDRFDLWRRWHISFVVFMRGHVFLPLVRHWHFPLPAALAATGILSGLWHGLGWTFVDLGPDPDRDPAHRPRPPGARPVAAARRRSPAPARSPLTFLTSALIGGLFRSPDLASRRQHLRRAGRPRRRARRSSLLGPRALIMLPVCAIAAWGLPNSAQFFARHWNALDLRQGAAPPPPHPLRRWLEFGLTPRWAAVAAMALALCLLLGAESGGSSMSSSDARRFLAAFAAVAALLAAAALLATWLLDPFGLLALGGLRGPACAAGARSLDERFSKPLLPRLYRPEEIVVGSSRAFWLFREEMFAGRRVANLSIPGASIDEIDQLVGQALADAPVRRVWIGADFGAFAMRDEPARDLERVWAVADRRLTALRYGLVHPRSLSAAFLALGRAGTCADPPVTATGFPAIRRSRRRSGPRFAPTGARAASSPSGGGCRRPNGPA